jgi:hypothetical protein
MPGECGAPVETVVFFFSPLQRGPKRICWRNAWPPFFPAAAWHWRILDALRSRTLVLAEFFVPRVRMPA